MRLTDAALVAEVARDAGELLVAPQSGQRGSRVTGVQKIVVVFSSTAASVIVTPNSMVRMIVSATTDGQAVAFDKGHLGRVGVWVLEPESSPTQAPPHRNDATPPNGISPTTDALIHEEPRNPSVYALRRTVVNSRART